MKLLNEEEVKALNNEMVEMIYTDWDAVVNGREVHYYTEDNSYPLVATQTGSWYSDGELLIHYVVFENKPTTTIYRLAHHYGVILD